MANQTGVPSLEVPFVMGTGVINIPWYRFIIALWQRTGGSTPTVFILSSPPTASGQIPVYDGAGWNPETIHGDASLDAAGKILVSKTNGTAFAPSATTDTTNATNISSGVLGSSVGGTGVNNGGNTVTLSGNLSISGGHNLTINTTAGTNVTLPSSGTLLSNSLTNTNLFVGNSSNVAMGVALSGDATLANTGALTLATVNAGVGTFTNPTLTVNAKGLITAASNGPTGISITITTAKITVAGANGSMTFTNGILTSQVQAT